MNKLRRHSTIYFLFAFGLIVAAGAVGAIVAWYTFQRDAVVKEGLQAEWQALKVSQQALKTAPTGNDWSAGAFVSTALLNQVLSAESGTTLSFNPQRHPDEDAKLTVQDVSVTGGIGTANVRATFNISSAKRNASLTVLVAGELLFSNIQNDGDHSEAIFRFVPTRIEPQLRWGFLDISGRRLASDLITTGLVTALSDRLVVPVPFKDHVAIDLGFDNTNRTPTSDGDNWVDLETKLPSDDLTRHFSVAAPLFTGHGVWLLLNETAAGQQAFNPPPAPNDEPTLTADIGQMSQELAKTFGGFLATDGGAIWMREDVFEHFVQDVAALPQDKRTVTIHSIHHAGYLIHQDWKDDLLGDGGYFVELDGDNSVSATIVAAPPTATWKPDDRLLLSMSAAGSADARVHAHFDPLIGGGIGGIFDLVGIVGSNLQGSVRTELVNTDNGKVAVLAPDITCKSVDIEIHVGSPLKFADNWNDQWLTMSSLGARVSQYVGKDPLDPLVMSYDGMEYLSFLNSSANSKDDFIYAPKWPFLAVDMHLSSAEAQDHGFLVTFGAEIQGVAKLPDGFDANAEEKNAQAKAKAVLAQEKPACPPLGNFQLLVGDHQFGPNNEIYKWLKNAWNDLTKGPGKNNEIRKVLDALGAQQYNDTTKQLADQVGQLYAKAFPTDSAVGHAAGELGKSETKVITNPPQAVHDFGTQLMKGFK